jgi:hypothetical protein
MYVCKKLQNNKHISDERSNDRSFQDFFVLKILSRDQGDQIGRIFTYRATVLFGQFFKI